MRLPATAAQHRDVSMPRSVLAADTAGSLRYPADAVDWPLHTAGQEVELPAADCGPPGGRQVALCRGRLWLRAYGPCPIVVVECATRCARPTWREFDATRPTCAAALVPLMGFCQPNGIRETVFRPLPVRVRNTPPALTAERDLLDRCLGERFDG